MPCHPFRSPDGKVTGIVCTLGERRAKCFYCRAEHERLCDAEITSGKTCDRKLCRAHAKTIGERDLCPDHDTAKHRGGEEKLARLRFFTGNVNQHRDDPDALDITIMTCGPEGRPFAPSMGIFVPARRAIERAKELRLEAEAVSERLSTATRLRTEADQIEASMWVMYRRGFLAEMLVSSGRDVPADWKSDVQAARARGAVSHVEAWQAELQRERRVYLCFCAGKEDERPERCHRTLVAAILVKMGATDMGELASPAKNPNQLSLLDG